MSPVELLKATQTAIGDSRLADLHTELIQEKKSSNVLTRVGLLTVVLPETATAASQMMSCVC